MSRLVWITIPRFTLAIGFLAAAPAALPAQSPTEIGKNHATVRRALVPAVARANRSVVRVFCGNQPEDVALGVVVSTTGHVLTKASELRGTIECLLPGGSRLPARIVTTDENLDLVLLKVEAGGLVPIQWADADSPDTGTLIAVAGRGTEPLALGVISGSPRSVPPTDGVLGVVVRQSDLGPKITQVMPGSVAEKSGLAPSDIVTHVGRRRVATCRDLVGFVSQFEPGQLFTLTIIRAGQTATIDTGLDKDEAIAPGAGLDRNAPSASRVPLSNRRGGFPEVFPHDAFLRPNDCGGPLVDIDGQAIGLNIARADRATSYALPARVVKQAIEQLLQKE